MASVEEIIAKLDACRYDIETWSRSKSLGHYAPPIKLDLSRADILERWEAILMDPDFPDKGLHSRHIARVLSLVDDGHLMLLRKK